MSWIECVCDNDYEIYTEYPYQIRRKSNKRIISEYIDKSKNNGYIRCSLNNKNKYKHKIIAEQFIPNDDPINKIEVDHINNIRTDNRIENLRWVSKKENMRNRKTYGKNNIYEYIDELPEDVIEIKFYKGIEFENYYYSPTNDKYYYDNGIKYRIMNIYKTKNGFDYICARDVTNHSRNLYIAIWKRDEGLN